MNKIILNIGGMTCVACSNSLEKYLNKQPDIIYAKVNLILEEAYIEYNDNITVDDINSYIKKCGFKSLGSTRNKNPKKHISLIIYSILAVIILTYSILFMTVFNKENNSIIYSSIILGLVLPFFIYGTNIFYKGIKGLIHLNLNMDSLVTFGVSTCFIYSFIQYILILNGQSSYVETLYFESCAFIIYFVNLGKYIDGIGKEKTKKTITELMEITPNKAIIKKDGKEEEVDIDTVSVNDIVILKPGMKASVDGIIISGSSHFDEKFITGETRSKRKNINDSIIAGSINLDGYIEYKATKIGRDSTISEIVNAIKESINSKTNLSNLADKISKIFIPLIIALSLLAFLIWFIISKDFNKAIIKLVTVLVVSCPCALGLAIPLGIVASHGVLAKNNILVKNNEIFNEISKIDIVCFDKTGTLTYGNYLIYKMFNYSNYSDKDLLNIVANIENNTLHPLKNAFNIENKIEVNDVKQIDGIGIKAKANDNIFYLGNNKLFNYLNIDNNYIKDELYLNDNSCSIIYVIKDNIVLSLIGLKDMIKSESYALINEMHKLNKKIYLITGDNEYSIKDIEKNIEIDKYYTFITPIGKAKIINDLKKEGHHVMMVGDGINDSISLVDANVGVCVNKSCDIATNSSDVFITSSNIKEIVTLLDIGIKTNRIIKENLFWAFFYNIIMIPIAFGALEFLDVYMSPVIGSICMMASSITLIINSWRINKYGKRTNN